MKRAEKAGAVFLDARELVKLMPFWRESKNERSGKNDNREKRRFSEKPEKRRHQKSENLKNPNIRP
jgi:hypothetical protein